MISQQTEELVTKTRLELIAREHRSMGAILDTRTLHPLEEVRPAKRSVRADAEKRLQGRRGGKSESDIKSKAHLAVESFKEHGLNVSNIAESFELEETIWRNKSSKRACAERRKFQYPELEEFFQHLNPSQQLDYEGRVSKRLIDLVESFRRDCARAKAEMDAHGVFHPDANAQRAHCLYLIRLERGISAQNIEDPVLMEMYQEEYERQLQELDAQVKKRQLLKEMEEKDSMVKDSGTSHARHPNDNALRMMDGREARDEATDLDIDELRKRIVTLKPFHKKVEEKRDLTKSKHPPKPLHKSQSANTIPAMKKSDPLRRSSTVAAPLMTKNLSSPVLKEEPTDNRVRLRSLKTQSSSAKIFDKKSNKFEQLGTLDSRLVLSSEAAKFDVAPVHVSKKIFDKNHLLDDTLSKWMLQELQRTEVTKACSGGLTSTALSVGTNLIDDDQPGHTSTVNFSPQKMMPFDEFYSILKANSDDVDLRESINCPPPPKNGKLSLEDSPLKPHETIGTQAHTEPLNIVKHLKEKDKHFDAFLKLSEREQPSSKLLAKLNASALKPRKQRRIPQVGKEAIMLSDSRGRPSKLASRGFTNVFLPAEADHNDFTEDNASSINVSVNVVKFDDRRGSVDIIDRLLGDHNVGENSSTRHRANSFESDAVRPPAVTSKSRLSNAEAKVTMEEALQFVRNHLEDCWDNTMFATQGNVEFDMQHKLIATWDMLSVSMHDRLAFMDKYSSSAYAAEMSRAVDMWAEIAVYVASLMGVIAWNKKSKDNLIIFPLNAVDVVKQILGRIHPLLAASVGALIPPALLYDMQAQSVPLSAAALVSVRNLLVSTVSSQNRAQNSESIVLIYSREDADRMFHDLTQRIAKELNLSLRRCHAEMDDVVPYGNVPCKEWLASLDISGRN